MNLRDHIRGFAKLLPQLVGGQDRVSARYRRIFAQIIGASRRTDLPVIRNAAPNFAQTRQQAATLAGQLVFRGHEAKLTKPTARPGRATRQGLSDEK